jgi:hypothetical protein
VRLWHLSVVWQQQVARHELSNFPQNTRNGPLRMPEDLLTSLTRHTDVDGPGAMPHEVVCVLLWPVDGYTRTSKLVGVSFSTFLLIILLLLLPLLLLPLLLLLLPNARLCCNACDNQARI